MVVICDGAAVAFGLTEIVGIGATGVGLLVCGIDVGVNVDDESVGIGADVIGVEVIGEMVTGELVTSTFVGKSVGLFVVGSGIGDNVERRSGVEVGF
jgi:hypothetical protein